MLLILAAAAMGGGKQPTSAISTSGPSQIAQATPTARPTSTPTATVATQPPPTEQPTIEPTPEVTPEPVVPATFAKLTSRQWAQLVKAPDSYVGSGYEVWACITQFDAATGGDSFRGDAANARLTYWSLDGTNAFFLGDSGALAPFVQDDIVFMKVVDLGSYTYDTTIGGSITVPWFEIVAIANKGSCAL